MRRVVVVLACVGALTVYGESAKPSSAQLFKQQTLESVDLMKRVASSIRAADTAAGKSGGVSPWIEVSTNSIAKGQRAATAVLLDEGASYAKKFELVRSLHVSNLALSFVIEATRGKAPSESQRLESDASELLSLTVDLDGHLGEILVFADEITRRFFAGESEGGLPVAQPQPNPQAQPEIQYGTQSELRGIGSVAIFPGDGDPGEGSLFTVQNVKKLLGREIPSLRIVESSDDADALMVFSWERRQRVVDGDSNSYWVCNLRVATTASNTNTVRIVFESSDTKTSTIGFKLSTVLTGRFADAYKKAQK